MESKEKDMPKKEIKVMIGKNEYAVKFPKNAQLIDIESAKIRMTGGANKDMIYGGPSAQQAYLAVEAIATFEILLPDMITDLNVKSLAELDMQQSKAFLKEYEKYYNWMESWRKYLNDDVVEEKKEDGK